MSGISSGIGLISGINFAELIDSLIAIERRPVETLQARVGELDIQRTVFIELSAQLLAMKNTAVGFSRSSFFKQFSSVSSNDSVLTGVAGSSAVPGTYSFRVRSLVASHALISRAFADRDQTPVGIGSITLDSALSKVNRDTDLELLNGGAGVRRGIISITDRSGASAEIDLSTAVTVRDVLEAINRNTTINVHASATGIAFGEADGDRIVIEDQTGGTGQLIIADIANGSAAADLGLVANVAADRVDGHDLLRLTNSTPLSLLNDGRGIGRFRVGEDLKFSTSLGDFSVSLSGNLATQPLTDLRALNSGQGVRLGTIRITTKDRNSAEIDLTNARTVQDVIDTINDSNLDISATVIAAGSDSFFLISDNSTAATIVDEENPPVMKIEDITGFAAADLGIEGEAENISGRSVYRVKTLGDVINAINYATDNNGLVEASITSDGNALFVRAMGLGNTVTVSAGVDTGSGLNSTAAADLGLLDVQNVSSFRTRNLIAGLNTVLLQSLRGGAGVSTGTINITDRSGATTAIDVSKANTLQDVIDLINQNEATGVTASVNRAGNGITLRDESGGLGAVVIEDVDSSLAADLGIAGTHTASSNGEIQSGNLQMQYVSRSTSLSDLNGGRGVTLGAFQITDSSGGVYTVDLAASAVDTVGDVIDVINRITPDTIEARLNETGDGLVIVDTSGGPAVLAIEDRDGGRTAADLHLAGSARQGDNFIDGSMEIRIEINATDTLDELARKINDSTALVSATVIRSGEGTNAFSLTLTSDVTGRRGEMVVDTIGLDLDLSTLSQAQDAVVTIGTSEGATRLVTSSTNSLEDVVPGVTLDLLSASDEPVTITIAQDVEAIVDSVQRFTDAFNTALDSIDEATNFDSETFRRGPLLGDPTVSLVRGRLIRLATRTFEGVDPSVSNLFNIGLQLGSGNRMQFDAERFREVYEQSPELVEQLFTQTESGFAATLDDMLDNLTRNFDGILSRKDDQLSDQQKLLNDRIESLNVLLEAKRARLQAQFVALESALAGLQAQQAALNSISLFS